MKITKLLQQYNLFITDFKNWIFIIKIMIFNGYFLLVCASFDKICIVLNSDCQIRIPAWQIVLVLSFYFILNWTAFLVNLKFINFNSKIVFLIKTLNIIFHIIIGYGCMGSFLVIFDENLYLSKQFIYTGYFFSILVNPSSSQFINILLRLSKNDESLKKIIMDRDLNQIYEYYLLSEKSINSFIQELKIDNTRQMVLLKSQQLKQKLEIESLKSQIDNLNLKANALKNNTILINTNQTATNQEFYLKMAAIGLVGIFVVFISWKLFYIPHKDTDLRSNVKQLNNDTSALKLDQTTKANISWIEKEFDKTSESLSSLQSQQRKISDINSSLIEKNSSMVNGISEQLHTLNVQISNLQNEILSLQNALDEITSIILP